jgi:Ni/Fe-hydrogenase 1 B-type cytochrome subunit
MASLIRAHDPADMERHSHRYYRRRYVWQWPIRIFHWVNALCVTTLFLSGLYIASPLMAPAGEAFGNNVMGTVRMVHFSAAFIFLISFLWRIYWFYMGNNYARSGFPMVWKGQWWSDLARQVGDYLRLGRGHIHLGHNALGGLAYTLFVIGLGWAQIFTGLGLYSESNPGGRVDRLFGWILPLLGGSMSARMFHHLFAWGFVVFAILHVYIVFYDGLQYRNGLVGSMVSGEKFYREGDLDHEDWLS